MTEQTIYLFEISIDAACFFLSVPSCLDVADPGPLSAWQTLSTEPAADAISTIFWYHQNRANGMSCHLSLALAGLRRNCSFASRSSVCASLKKSQAGITRHSFIDGTTIRVHHKAT
ncbi:hypothetical protein [Komagataeibacter xylinus]|uniref:hypothetical protein n=1 Tax=Komagataeibacter xylinus TaxID=28448 RepID=UPI00280BA29E|nr:hypothetical protein [Komagataeibacter xylinus]